MDLTSILRFYVDKMLKEVAGMKVLILDAETTQMVSLVYSQSEILEQEVFLVEKLEAQSGEQLTHLKAVCFLRPTRENIARLRRELREPRFGEYNLFFTNRIEDLRLQDIAEMDTKELVAQVQEFFGDVEVVDQHHFLIPIPRPYVALQPFSWEYANSTEAIARITEGLAALILSLRRRFSVRYQRGSEMCEKLAQSLHQLTNGEERELFDFGTRGAEVAPTVLLIDRKEDPVTPLLMQWTYQAMVHELLGIHANRVNLPPTAHVGLLIRGSFRIGERLAARSLRELVRKDFQELVLSARQDEFYRTHRYKNFGDIGTAVKDLVDDFQRHSAQGRNVSSLEDMQNFVDSYSEYNAAQRNASKHVTLISTLSTIVDNRTLMQVSSAEQEVSCSSSNPQSHYELVSVLLDSPHVTDQDRMRLVLLYALRYEREGRAQVGGLMEVLQNLGLPRQQLGLLKTLLEHAGADQRTGDLYSNRTFSSRFATMAKQNLRGVENVYTQHTPLLASTLEALVKGRLRDTDFPCIGKAPASTTTPGKPPKLVVVFVVGGTTYEEAKAIADLNLQGERGEGWAAGTRFLLGGNCVQNSESFLRMLTELQMNKGYR